MKLVLFDDFKLGVIQDGRVADAMREEGEAEERGLVRGALEGFARALGRGWGVVGGPRLKVVAGGLGDGGGGK